MSSSTSNSLI
uniref:Uncharacterized protein n=1 Tax=Arundo donax TaxID=35708 RepID=A0A0A9FPQ3_ARUDO